MPLNSSFNALATAHLTTLEKVTRLLEEKEADPHDTLSRELIDDELDGMAEASGHAHRETSTRCMSRSIEGDRQSQNRTSLLALAILSASSFLTVCGWEEEERTCSRAS